MYHRLLLFIISNCLYLIIVAQPTIRMQNGSMSTCEMFIVDSDSLQGNYASGVRTLTITSANNTRLAFNMELFDRRNDNDNMAVFDGPTTGSPLLTTILSTGTIVGGSGPWYAVSTGSSLTLRFTASASQLSQGRFRSKIRCIADPAGLSVFQPVKNTLGIGNIQIADYDKDNDKDILMGGVVYRNDSYTDSFYLVERKIGVMDGWVNPQFITADFDNDGDKDVFISGQSAITGFTGVRCALYTNDGTGAFTRLTGQAFDPAYSGACSVVDFNNDGKPDICYTGRTNPTGTPVYIFRIYFNNGNMSFTDANINLPGITGLQTASMSWGDSEGDGDPDLVIQGYNGVATYSRLFLNNGNSLAAQTVALTNVSSGRIAWVDVNIDGKRDIVNTGVITAGGIDAIIPEILFNNGNNSFTRVATNLPALPAGTHDWADYDKDGDNDVVMCGMNVSDLSSNTAVYRNNGNGNFTRIEIDGAAGMSTVKWTDINQDGKPDVFVTGKRSSYSYFVKNMGADVFKKCSFPITNYDTRGTVLVDDFTADGRVDLLFIGDLEDADCYGSYTSILVKAIDWRITGVPNFTKVADLRNSNPNGITTLGYSPYWKWGDYDSDGNLDILLTTDLDGDVGPNGYIIIFRNMGNNNFVLAYNTYTTPLPTGSSANRRQVGVFDIDNDGRNELFVTPNSVFKWVNNVLVPMYEDPATCGIDCKEFYVDFADYDKDGFMDAAVNNRGLPFILHNNRAGRLVPVKSISYAKRQVKWYDMDNDGDPDLVLTEGIAENRNGELTYVGSGIKEFVHTAIGDFNGDGSPDLMNMTYTILSGPGDFYLNMQNTMFFKQMSTGKLMDCVDQPWEEAVESFDMDNDGDDDIVHTANWCCTPSVIFANMYNVMHRNIHVMTPNGGETFASGTAKTIQWIGTQIGATVKIELSRDSLQSWETISPAANSTVTGGSFQWAVIGPASTKCFIRITDNSNSTFFDISNASFTISTVTAVNNPQTTIPLRAFPNPAREILYVEAGGNTGIIGEATLFNVQGSELSRISLHVMPGHTADIDIRKLTPGVYFLKIQSARKTGTVKFIKW